MDPPAEANGAMAEPVPLEFAGGGHAAETEQLEGPPIHFLVELEVERPDVMGILSS